MAQLAEPNMCLPIQIALLGNGGDQIIDKIDFSQMLKLTFEPSDGAKFPCVNLAYEVFDMYPLAPTVMNGANDVCVQQFLQGKLAFDKFYPTIMQVVRHFEEQLKTVPVTVENIIKFDQEAQKLTNSILNGVV